MEKLFNKTKLGQVQTWEIFYEGNKFWTVEGIEGGVMTTSLPTICTGKNIGKKNETSPSEQAEAEAKAKWQKKIDKGYATDIANAGAQFLEPMLAFEYDKYPIDWDKEEDIYGQPKLDGLRSINNGKEIKSRNGKLYVATPHLLHKYDIALDGELYTHQYKDDFNAIVSLCKKQKPTIVQLKESEEKVEMWVYDYPSHNGTFSERFEALKAIKDLPKGIVIVPTVKLSSQAELDEFHANNLAEGYEGTIIRRNLPYENKRSKILLKYKDFKDEEFTIVGFEEGTGGRVGTIGYFIMQHDKNPTQTFKSNVKGNFDFLRDVWQNAKSYVGTEATVKYFQRTPKQSDGTGDVPRFPYIIKLNRKEYE